MKKKWNEKLKLKQKQQQKNLASSVQLLKQKSKTITICENILSPSL